MITLAKVSDVFEPSPVNETRGLFKAIRTKHEECMYPEAAYDEAQEDMWFLRNNYLDTLQDVFSALAR